MMKKILFFLILTIMISGFCNAYASEPLTILKEEIDKVFSILNDPKYNDSSKKEQQHSDLWEVIDGIFDFNAISKLALANNWRDFSPEQQKDFAQVFGNFLGNNYLNKIQSGFSDQQVEFTGEEMIRKNRAVVMTNIIKNNIKTPVNYSMINQGNSWKIYDVKIEGVSLLKNYRTQFSSILLKDKPDKLINDLRNKLK
ncbi:phospholipid-binding protein MlaC [Thermodesulfobacteriota bacterium]